MSLVRAQTPKARPDYAPSSNPSLGVRTSRSLMEMAGPATPPHVEIIRRDGVHVAAMTGTIRRDLVRAGRSISRTRYGPPVPYEVGPSVLDNADLIGLLQLLASLGVGFARDYKQMWSPAAVVAELIDRGHLFDDPWACGFEGHVWRVQHHPWSTA